MNDPGNAFSRENMEQKQNSAPPFSPVYRRPKDSCRSGLATYTASKQMPPQYPVASMSGAARPPFGMRFCRIIQFDVDCFVF